jgi:hypothetical protein
MENDAREQCRRSNISRDSMTIQNSFHEVRTRIRNQVAHRVRNLRNELTRNNNQRKWEVRNQYDQNHSALNQEEAKLREKISNIRRFPRAPLSSTILPSALELDGKVKISASCCAEDSAVPHVRGGCLISLLNEPSIEASTANIA